MTIHYNLYAVLVAAAIVFGLSVIGSFICWMNDTCWERGANPESQANRWKWMVIVFFIILSVMLLAKP